MKICVQIGLWQSAEYIFLAAGKLPKLYRKNSTNSEVLLFPGEVMLYPEEYHDGEWQYFGIDCDPASVVLMSNKYDFLTGNIDWVCARIIPKGMKLVEGYTNWASHSTVKIYELGIDLSTLFQQLNLDAVDLLVVDIEGAEYEIFDEFDFEIKPKFIILELHPTPAQSVKEGFERINVQMRKQGYTIPEILISENLNIHAHYILNGE